jgi:ABC-type multidrug transport system fused ATPase/permease subunit
VYKTLDDNGIEFSGGEGQKLALARAIYKDAETLILDEPTSALDPIAEYELFSKLNDISDNKSTIFISHRLSSTKFCDKIIVLSGGEIIECGSHEKLIKQHGVYADLFNAQAKYYRERGVAANE